jgi:hypothetical protein
LILIVSAVLFVAVHERLAARQLPPSLMCFGLGTMLDVHAVDIITQMQLRGP